MEEALTSDRPDINQPCDVIIERFRGLPFSTMPIALVMLCEHRFRIGQQAEMSCSPPRVLLFIVIRHGGER
jgi:hypothetical protein